MTPANTQVAAPTQPARQLQSTQIFAGNKLVVISHDGNQYILRITRNGKLILTK